ncbi:uncharacterized protein LOC116297545, partial [Actinia tenebrosa]|uniref:Uncharacterized protein LOC116297545 n=1 Tax=Actinia tenebrosa TaxID=6105 RepID=A0A6P8I292_ACTTE
FAEKGLETLQKSAEVALNRYEEKDHDLCSKLQKNRSEQDELRKRLAALQVQEAALEDERDEKKATQQRAEQTEKRARDELQNWKRQIEELHRCCQAALSVMWQFKEGSFKLINSSIVNKTNEERHLHELDILAHKTLREALVAASLDCKEVIKSSDASLELITKLVG